MATYKATIEARVRVTIDVKADDLAQASVAAQRECFQARTEANIWAYKVKVLGEPRVVEVKK